MQHLYCMLTSSRIQALLKCQISNNFKRHLQKYIILFEVTFGYELKSIPKIYIHSEFGGKNYDTATIFCC